MKWCVAFSWLSNPVTPLECLTMAKTPYIDCNRPDESHNILVLCVLFQKDNQRFGARCAVQSAPAAAKPAGAALRPQAAHPAVMQKSQPHGCAAKAYETLDVRECPTAKEFSAQRKTTRQQVHKMIANGKLPAVKISRE